MAAMTRRREGPNRERMNVMLSPAIARKLRAEAAEEGTFMSWIVEDLLRARYAEDANAGEPR